MMKFLGFIKKYFIWIILFNFFRDYLDMELDWDLSNFDLTGLGILTFLGMFLLWGGGLFLTASFWGGAGMLAGKIFNKKVNFWTWFSAWLFIYTIMVTLLMAL